MKKIFTNTIATNQKSLHYLKIAMAILGVAILLVQPLAALADVGDAVDTSVPVTTDQSQSGTTNGSTDGSNQQAPDPTPTPVAPTPTPTVVAPTPTPTTVDGSSDQTSTTTISNDPAPNSNSDVSDSSSTPDDSTSTPPSDTGSGDSSSTPVDATSTPDLSGITIDGLNPDDGSTTPADSSSTPADSSSTPNSTQTTGYGLVGLLNDNTTNATTTATSTGDTGDNAIAAAGNASSTAVYTGNVNIYANVLTIANNTLVNSQLTELTGNFNQVANDLYLDQPNLPDGQKMQDMMSALCGSGNCLGLTTFELANQNSANVNNSVDASGNSGGNSITAGGNANGSQITTGNVNVVANVLNIVNTNLVNSHWTIVSFNIFGNFSGNLVLPSEFYFTNGMSLGDQSLPNLSQLQQATVNISNANTSNIQNNVSVGASTGNNSVTAGGSAQDVQVSSGDATAQSQIDNVTNLTAVNSNWFLGLVNVLGSWSGNIYSLPSNVSAQYSPGSLMLVSTGSNDPGAAAGLQTALGSTSCDSGCNSGPSTLDVTNQNQANIVNNVNVSAMTGNNSVAAGGNVGGVSMSTGNASALANIINFANANLINSNLFVGLVNVFGDWNGNLLFGYPDLAVGQQLLQEKMPAGPDRQANVNINYANLAGSSMVGSQLTWKYDPGYFQFDATNSPFPYTQPAPGEVVFNLGTVAPYASGNIQVQLKTLQYVPEGNFAGFYAGLFGSGPEEIMSNNQSLLMTWATKTGSAIVPPLPGGSFAGSSDPSYFGGNVQGSASITAGDSLPYLLQVSKTNDATGPVAPGDSVNFTVTVNNSGFQTLQNVQVFDSLKGPDGSVIKTQEFDLGDMASGDEATVNYSLDTFDNATPGTYTNSAYAVGTAYGLGQWNSANTATSQFTIADSSADGSGSGSQSGSNSSTTPGSGLQVVPGGITPPGPIMPTGLPQSNSSSSTPAVAGASTTRKGGGGSGGGWPGHPGFAQSVNTFGLPKFNPGGFTVPPVPGLLPATAAATTQDQPSHSGDGNLPLTFLLCFLIALGYAAANARQRMRAVIQVKQPEPNYDWTGSGTTTNWDANAYVSKSVSDVSQEPAPKYWQGPK